MFIWCASVCVSVPGSVEGGAGGAQAVYHMGYDHFRTVHTVSTHKHAVIVFLRPRPPRVKSHPAREQ